MNPGITRCPWKPSTMWSDISLRATPTCAGQTDWPCLRDHLCRIFVRQSAEQLADRFHTCFLWRRSEHQAVLCYLSLSHTQSQSKPTRAAIWLQTPSAGEATTPLSPTRLPPAGKERGFARSLTCSFSQTTAGEVVWSWVSRRRPDLARDGPTSAWCVCVEPVVSRRAQCSTCACLVQALP